MKGMSKNKSYPFNFFLIILFFLFLSACGGVAPDNGSSGTDPPTVSSFTASSKNKGVRSQHLT
ncbi:MAG TPA: hypothetical protein ENN27_04805 [Candidatus Atribacteria bacterium]|nr:hypothetical protein [Candidatus Atribacteria bacterium]